MTTIDVLRSLGVLGIAEAVAAAHGVTMADAISGLTHPAIRARRVIWGVMLVHCRMSDHQIAEAFGLARPATVAEALDTLPMSEVRPFLPRSVA